MKKNLNKAKNLIYKILISKYSNKYIYGLPILYVQKAHEEYIKPYSFFFNNKKYSFKLANNLKKIKIFINNLFNENKNFYNKNISHQKYDILLLSSIISEKNLKQDYIYGQLAKELKKKKIKTLTVFRNFLKKPSSKLINKHKLDSIILSKTCSVINEILFLFGIYKTKRSLNYLTKKIQSKKIKKFLYFINQLNFLTPIMSTLRLAFQMQLLIRKFRPKIIIITLENHAWERYLINKIKEVNSDIIVAGYQFSTITKNQFSKQYILKKNYNPDIIFTSGRAINYYLKNIFKKKIRILNLGNYRQNLLKMVQKTKKQKKILFVPESPISEAEEFYFKCINLAKKNNDYNFTLRLHPMSHNKSLQKLIINKTKYLKNFNLSKKSLIKDLEQNNYIVYRSSSLCIMGALNGLIPLYFSSTNSDLDPFFQINKKFKFNSDQEFKKVLSLKNFEKKNYINQSRNYSKKYFEKINLLNIQKLLNNLN